MKFIRIVVLIAASAGNAWAVGAPERIWGPAVQRIQKAVSIPDTQARESALRNALRDGLIASNRETANQVFAFLSENSRWMDLQPVSDVIEEFSKSDSRHRGIWLLDDNELAHSPVDVRKQVYREAIEGGTAKLRRGSPLTRASAIISVAFEGITELRPLVDKYSPLVEERWKESLQFNSIPALFELTGGTTGRGSAAEQAAIRLTATNE